MSMHCCCTIVMLLIVLCLLKKKKCYMHTNISDRKRIGWQQDRANGDEILICSVSLLTPPIATATTLYLMVVIRLFLLQNRTHSSSIVLDLFLKNINKFYKGKKKSTIRTVSGSPNKQTKKAKKLYMSCITFFQFQEK